MQQQCTREALGYSNRLTLLRPSAAEVLVHAPRHPSRHTALLIPLHTRARTLAHLPPSQPFPNHQARDGLSKSTSPLSASTLASSPFPSGTRRPRSTFGTFLASPSSSRSATSSIRTHRAPSWSTTVPLGARSRRWVLRLLPQRRCERRGGQGGESGEWSGEGGVEFSPTHT